MGAGRAQSVFPRFAELNAVFAIKLHLKFGLVIFILVMFRDATLT